MSLALGDKVVLMGLQAASRCNGRHGVIVRAPEGAAPDRVAVRLAAFEPVHVRAPSRDDRSIAARARGRAFCTHREAPLGPALAEVTVVAKRDKVFSLSSLADADVRARYLAEQALCALGDGVRDTLLARLQHLPELLLYVAGFLPVEERVALFCGFHGGTFEEVLCHTAGGWHVPTRMPAPRLDCAVLPLPGGRVAFVGGVDGHPQLPSTRPTRAAAVFDPLSYSWSQLAPMAAARHGCCGAVDADGRAYVVGGLYACDEGSRALERLSAGAAAWEALPPPAADRTFAAAGFVGGRLVLAGGESQPNGVERRAEAFDPAAGAWRNVEPMAEARSAMGYCTCRRAAAGLAGDGAVLVVAGGRSERGEPMRTVEAFDGERWWPLPPMRHARLGGTLVVHDGALYAIGGLASPSGAFTASVERLTPPKEADRGLADEAARLAISGGDAIFSGEVEALFNHAKSGHTVGRPGTWDVVDEMATPYAYHACHAVSVSQRVLGPP